jgi:hypothetical protein
MYDYFEPERERAGNAQRLARIDAMYAREALRLKHPKPIGHEMYTPQDMIPSTDPTARTSAAHGAPMSPAELQKLDPPPTPPGVKREGVGGYVYPKSSFEVL